MRELVELARGLRWGEFIARHGDWGKPLFLWAVRRHCGLTLRETGNAAGGMSPRAVDMSISRFHSRVARDAAIRIKQQEIDNQLKGESWKVEH